MMNGSLLYPLISPLAACSTDEINDAYNWLDEYTKTNIESFFYVFPMFSSGEASVIYASWQLAHEAPTEGV